MAFVQTVTDRLPANPISVADGDGYYYRELGGGKRYYTGKGSPNGVITAPIGSLADDGDTSGLMWRNSDASTTWQEIGDVT